MGKKKRESIRQKYTTKEVRIKQAPKKPVPKGLKYGILFCAIALVVAVILFFALYNDGSLPMENGKPVMQGDNWLLANVGSSNSPKYYKVGEVAPVEGYVRDTETELEDWIYMYKAEDAENRIGSYYVTGVNRVPDVNAGALYDSYTSFVGEWSVTPVQTATIGGDEVDYFTTATPPAADTATQQQFIAYLPGIRNTSVMTVITANVTVEEPALSEEELMAFYEQVKDSITLEAK